MNFKKWWSKKKGWQKWGVIGLVIGILPLISTFIPTIFGPAVMDNGVFLFLGKVIFLLIEPVELIFKFEGILGGLSIIFIYTPLFYLGIGIIIGIIMDKIENRKIMGLKEWWGRRKNWQKGGIIGVVIGILPILSSLITAVLTSRGMSANNDIIFFLGRVSSLVIKPVYLIFRLEGLLGGLLIFFVITPIFYLLLGISIGIIIDKMMKHFII